MSGAERSIVAPSPGQKLPKSHDGNDGHKRCRRPFVASHPTDDGADQCHDRDDGRGKHALLRAGEVSLDFQLLDPAPVVALRFELHDDAIAEPGEAIVV